MLRGSRRSGRPVPFRDELAWGGGREELATPQGKTLQERR